MMGVPFCTERWSEIIPNLFVGGHDYDHGGGWIRDVVVHSEFDVVISLYERQGCGPAPDVDHYYLRIPDGGLTHVDLGKVRELAEVGAGALREGKRTLVRCQAGLNRSALLAAFILLRRGVPADDAIELIRRRRGSWALHNQAFLEYIAEEAEAVCRG
jgi:hypothetical protein